MGRGYAGANALAFLETKYEYAGSEFYDPSEFYDFLKYNLEMAKDTQTYQKYMPDIGKLAVQFAQDLVVSNGTYRTGKLHDSIHWAPNSTGITLFANARDSRGSAYAGHIEYGFVGRDGMPHGPWPFLRPAMRMAAEASQGMLADEAARSILWGRDDAILSFGRAGVKHLLGRTNAHRRAEYINQTGHRFGAWRGSEKRWTGAKHGIDHMKNLKSDTSDEGKAIYESFKSTFGESMDRTDFRYGDL